MPQGLELVRFAIGSASPLRRPPPPRDVLLLTLEPSTGARQRRGGGDNSSDDEDGDDENGGGEAARRRRRRRDKDADADAAADCVRGRVAVLGLVVEDASDERALSSSASHGEGGAARNHTAARGAHASGGGNNHSNEFWVLMAVGSVNSHGPPQGGGDGAAPPAGAAPTFWRARRVQSLATAEREWAAVGSVGELALSPWLLRPRGEPPRVRLATDGAALSATAGGADAGADDEDASEGAVDPRALRELGERLEREASEAGSSDDVSCKDRRS